MMMRTVKTYNLVRSMTPMLLLATYIGGLLLSVFVITSIGIIAPDMSFIEAVGNIPFAVVIGGAIAFIAIVVNIYAIIIWANSDD